MEDLVYVIQVIAVRGCPLGGVDCHQGCRSFEERCVLARFDYWGSELGYEHWSVTDDPAGEVQHIGGRDSKEDFGAEVNKDAAVIAFDFGVVLIW
jgi:hypothetical protein